MRRSAIFIFWLTLASIIFSRCGNDDDEPVATAPGTTLVFINGQSLSLVEAGIDVVSTEIDTTDSNLNDVQVEISVLEDSLATLEQLINEGAEDLDDELASVKAMLTVLETEESTLQDQLAIQNAVLDSLENRQAIIASGAIVVSRITNLNNGLEAFYSDTITSLPIPLEVSLDETAYELEIASTNYDLLINYEREQTIDIERVVRITASSLAAFSSSFDSLQVECPESNPNCRSGETVITCYF